MKFVRFPIYCEVCGYQELALPDYIDPDNERAVKDYIANMCGEIGLPEDCEYVGDPSFDLRSPIEVFER